MFAWSLGRSQSEDRDNPWRYWIAFSGYTLGLYIELGGHFSQTLRIFEETTSALPYLHDIESDVSGYKVNPFLLCGVFRVPVVNGSLLSLLSQFILV